MLWNLRQYTDRDWLLIGTCPDCVVHFEKWCDSPLVTPEQREAIAKTHICQPINTSNIEGYRKNILDSYQHVLGEGWGTNLPTHMWYWPSKDIADYQMVSMPHIAPESLTGGPTEVQDQLFPFQAALGRLMLSEEAMEPAFMYIVHVEVLTAESIRLQEFLVAETPSEAGTVGFGAQTVYTMDEDKKLFTTEAFEPLDGVSNIDGILSVMYLPQVAGNL